MKRIGFIPVPGFNLMSLGAAIEPLRIANRVSGETLFQWTTLWGGSRTEASNGLVIEAERELSEHHDLDVLFVCSSFRTFEAKNSGIVTSLRGVAARHDAVGAIGTGTYFLAWAGLLANTRCTIHWEHLPAFAEAFPHVAVTANIYEIDKQVFTSGGGTAVLDMMLQLISDWVGKRLAVDISSQILSGSIRPASDNQQKADTVAASLTSPALAAAALMMRNNIEEPLSIPAIADRVGLSQRQLERLFKTHYGCSPLDHYVRIRLERARNLLFESPLTVTDVALAVGFSTTGHFSRKYAERFGVTPGADRRRARVSR